jgi:MYXO-CTERM domain-containing protein
MKISSFSKFVGASVIAASLAILPLTVSAQGQTDTTAPDTYNRTNTVETADTYENNDSDWGWLGLLGLAGLAGLLPRKRRETVYRSDHNSYSRDNEPDVVVRSRSDYR